MRYALTPIAVFLACLLVDSAFAAPARPEGDVAAPPPAPAASVVGTNALGDPCCIQCPRWTLSLGLWVWGVDGTVGDGGREFDVDADWTDTLEILDKVEFALDARLRVEWSKWRFTAGIDGATIEDSAEFQDGALEVAGQLEIWTAYAHLGYVIAGGRFGCTACDPTWCLDAYAGARFYAASLEISAVVGGPAAVDSSDEWLDPLVGLHLGIEARKWFFVAEADVGGFGVGSDFAWSALAAVGYRFSRGFATTLGWKVLDVDREEGDFLFDVQLSGPFVALTFSW
jgi:hypothetical protein